MPAACPRPAQLEADVARLVGARLRHARALLADVSVHGRAVRSYQLTLRVDGGTGRAERTLELESCAEVARAAVLLIGTALQMDAFEAEASTRQELASAPAAPPAEVPAVEPPSDTTAEPAERPRRMQRPRRPWGLPSWWLRLGGTFDVAALPGATTGPFAGVGIQLRWLRAWLEGRYLLPRERVDDVSAQPVEIGLCSGALGAGAAVRRGAFSFGPSAELESGVLRGRVLGEYAAGKARTAWLALLAGGHVELTVRDGMALALDALVGLPLVRPAFVVEDQPAFYRTRPLTARIAMGIRVHLGP